ncbi:MAG: InlB B-repeat-containing protein [Paludibacteraceae bacterium]|nr:InlB B-repeat-containing protein [Paludibacteraceae bacterium]
MKNHILTALLFLMGSVCFAQDEQPVSGQIAGHDYVELGLPSGTLWATYNVGATKPTEYGDYFAWGETKPKEEYNFRTYKWCKGSYDSMTKYCTESGFGFVDKKTVLDSEDDAATANWGGSWRMPTKNEIIELIDGCTWEWIENFQGSGVNGCLGNSKLNGASIFLPAAGNRQGTDFEKDGKYGYYWSSSLDKLYPDDAYNLYFSNDGKLHYKAYYRHYGYNVRAVSIKEYTVSFYTKDSVLIESQKVKKGKSATAVDAPTVDGYEFIGWSDSSFTNVTKDLDIYAQYIKLFNVSFYTKDSVLIESQKVEKGKSATAVDAPVVDGYEFIGWSDSSFTNVTKDLDIYARYARLFNVSFYTKDSVLIESQKVEKGMPATAVDAPAVDGYEFIGWSDSSFTNVTKDLDIYARYARLFNVSFYTKDSVLIESQKVEKGMPATAVDAPAVDGYEFIGWSDSSFTNVTKDMDVYAQYIRLFNVSFYTKDSVLIESQKVEKGKSATAVDAPAVEGYEFIGWSDSSFTNVAKDLNVYAQYKEIIILPVSGQIAGHDYVDLGLPSGTLWATYNVGATKPTEYGDYFAWGETNIKKVPSFWKGYKFCDDDLNITKYSMAEDGDSLVTLLPEDDAATANWGNSWRMPTWYEFQELIDGCTWTYKTNMDGIGVKGYLGVSKTNNSAIFIPEAGCDYNVAQFEEALYWTSSLIGEGPFLLNSLIPKYAVFADFSYRKNVGCNIILFDWDVYRYFGLSVRAVFNDTQTDAPVVKQQGIFVFADNGTIHVANAQAHSNIHVFDMNGKVRASSVTDGFGNAELSVSKGVYVVTDGNQSTKVILK